MALINTEEAAKRLARVILSDIELYNRERPQAGESLAQRVEEGRKLFGSRVTPAVVQLFDVVLEDRRAAVSAKTPPVAAMVSVPAVAPTLARQALEGRPTPAPIPVARLAADRQTPVRVAAHIRDEQTTPVVLMAAAPIRALRTPPPPPRSSPPPPPLSLAPSAAAPEITVPVLTSRISFARVLVISAISASAAAVILLAVSS